MNLSFLTLCCEKAFDKLPSCLRFLLTKVPSWFSRSTIQRDALKELFHIMDPNDERHDTPCPFRSCVHEDGSPEGKWSPVYSVQNWYELKCLANNYCEQLLQTLLTDQASCSSFRDHPSPVLFWFQFAIVSFCSSLLFCFCTRYSGDPVPMSPPLLMCVPMSPHCSCAYLCRHPHCSCAYLCHPHCSCAYLCQPHCSCA